MIASASGTLWLTAQKRTVNGARSSTESSVTSLQLDLLEQAVLVELGLGEGQRKAAAVHRHVDVAQHEGQRAEMVLVPVGDEKGEDVVAMLAQPGDVGQHEVDAEHLVARERKAAVDHDDLAAVLDGRHVLADLAHAAERHDLQGVIIHVGFSRSSGRRGSARSGDAPARGRDLS